MGTRFDLGYLEMRGTIRHVCDGLFIGGAQPLTLTLNFCGAGTPAAAALDNVRLKGGDENASLRAVAPHAIASWENAIDSDTKQPAPCTPDAIRELVDELVRRKATELLNRAVIRAMNPANFRDAPPTDPLPKG